MAKKKIKEIKIKGSEKFQLWNSRIATMKVYMSNAADRKQWDNLRKYYKGEYKQALKLSMPIVVVNLVKAFVRTSISSLFARNPKFKCNPTKGKSSLAAKIAEQALNYFWYVNKIKRQIKKAIKEGKLIGYSWIKVGYNAEVGVEADGESEYIKDDEVFAVYVKHDAIWYDTEAQDAPHDCRWMVHHYLKPTDKLREKYPGKDIKSTEEIDYTSTTKRKDNLLKPKDKEVTRVYEIWDIENKEILFLSNGFEGDFLEVKKWKYKIKGFPFIMLTFDTMIDLDDEDNIPESEILGFIDQIFEKIKIRSMQMNHLKRFGRQLIASKGKIDEAELKKFELGIDGAIILVDNEQGALDNVIKAIQYPPIQADIYAVENRIDIDFDSISGQSGIERNVPVATKTRTLGEVQQISEGAKNRNIEQQDIVEEFTEEVARKIIALMRQYFDGERYARILGDVTQLDKMIFQKAGVLEGGSLKFTKDQIQGEYDIEVVAGSTLPLNPANRLNHLLSISRFATAFGLGPQSITSMYLGKSIMEELELKDVARAYEIDIQRAMQPKQPSPEEKLKNLQAKQNIDGKAVDTKLKKSRVEGNELSNLAKAIKASRELEGKDEVRKVSKE